MVHAATKEHTTHSQIVMFISTEIQPIIQWGSQHICFTSCPSSIYTYTT